MGKNSLDKREMDELREMVKQGIRPQDLAKKFDVAISSIHNYKTQFRKEGMEIPSTRGRRPIGHESVSGNKHSQLHTVENTQTSHNEHLGDSHETTSREITAGVSEKIESKFIKIKFKDVTFIVPPGTTITITENEIKLNF